jgi:hypothetical protein
MDFELAEEQKILRWLHENLQKRNLNNKEIYSVEKIFLIFKI